MSAVVRVSDSTLAAARDFTRSHPDEFHEHVGGFKIGARVRCDSLRRELGDVCGRVLVEGWITANGGFEFTRYSGAPQAVVPGDHYKRSRPNIKVVDLTPRGSHRTPNDPANLYQLAVLCRCGSAYLLRNDRVLPAFEEGLCDRPVSTHGWVDVPASEVSIDLPA